MSELIAARAFVIPGTGRAAESAPARPGLLARIGTLVRRYRNRRMLRSLDPHLARDIGISAAADPLAGFAVDPRPLWRAGLTPMPSDTLPPWSRGRW